MDEARDARYLAKVDQRGPDECWPWIAARNQFGYGMFCGDELGDGRREQLAHRYGYRLRIGPIADGLHVCHTCDNPPCQNPRHWFLGTATENHADKVRKGRQGRVTWTRGALNSRAKLTDAEIVEIRRRCRAGETQERVAADFGIAQTAVSKIMRGMRWAHVSD